MLFLFCKACFVNLAEPEKEKLKVKKQEEQKKKKKKAATNRAKKSLQKILNDKKLKKYNITVTEKSDFGNSLMHTDQ